ncbi:DUF2573 family protein [Priestia megaterium]|nr:DUF2573 family protein [Priestia megaterium]
MDKQFKEQLEGLLEKYTELMVGESNEELKEKIQAWVIYTYISKSMPPLIKHWNQLYPEAKAEMVNIVKEIKALNEQHRTNQHKQD